jgi:hypothetical protein
MPLKRMLEEGRSFGPKAVALLLEAFDGIVAELDLRSAADREKAAKIVMRLALGQAHLDGAKLRHDAIGLMRKEGIKGRRRLLKNTRAEAGSNSSREMVANSRIRPSTMPHDVPVAIACEGRRSRACGHPL